MRTIGLPSVRISSVLFFICLSVLAQPVHSQNYSKLKITTKQGQTITGTKGILSPESVQMTVSSQLTTIPLSDVQSIMSKKGSAWKWALGCGGGCMALGLVEIIWYSSSPDMQDELGYTVGQLTGSCLLWVAISAGIGSIIGVATDSWQPVFFGKNAAFINRFNLNLNTDNRGHLLAGLSYKFSF